MAQQNIDFGTAAANDGETLLTAMPKIEDNFTELYALDAADAAALAAHIADTTAAHAASAISYGGSAGLSATDVEGALDELDSEKQPLDSDLTAIAALSTQSYGRSLLETASASAARTLVGLAYGIGVRERLTTSRTYYVSTTGSDSNDGLTALTPFATVNKARDVIQETIDMADFQVVIQLADGTYAEAISFNRPWTGGGIGASIPILRGNTSTPANVIINPASGNAVSAILGGTIQIEGMELRTTSGGYGLDAGGGGRVQIGESVRFGSVASGFSHIVCDSFGLVVASNDYSIVAGADTHWLCFENGVIEVSSKTITLSGTPAFATAFAAPLRGGHISAVGNTYSGSATGARFNVRGNGSIWTNGAGLTALPGNSAGAFNGGWYDNQFGGSPGQIPVVQGGDAASSTLTLKSTSGAGTTDAIIFQVGNNGATEAARVTTGGKFLWGSATAQTGALAVDSDFQVHRLSGNTLNPYFYRWSNDANGAQFAFMKSRGTSVGTHTVVQNNDVLGVIRFSGSDGTNFEQGALISGEVDGTPGNDDLPVRLVFSTTPDGSTSVVERLRISQNGFVSVLGGSFGRGAPVTKTADFTVADTENNLINNKSGSTCTVTLPSASSFSGREIMIKTIQAQTVVSGSSNVAPIHSATPGTAIIPVTPNGAALSTVTGRWAKLVSDGSNWIVMAGG